MTAYTPGRITSHTLRSGATVHISDGQAFYRLPGSGQLITITPSAACRMIFEDKEPRS